MTNISFVPSVCIHRSTLLIFLEKKNKNVCLSICSTEFFSAIFDFHFPKNPCFLDKFQALCSLFLKCESLFPWQIPGSVLFIPKVLSHLSHLLSFYIKCQNDRVSTNSDSQHSITFLGPKFSVHQLKNKTQTKQQKRKKRKRKFWLLRRATCGAILSFKKPWVEYFLLCTEQVTSTLR